jgi:phospholipid transport system substrate-binding protein
MRFVFLLVLMAFAASPSLAAAKCEPAAFVISAGRAYDQAARSGNAATFAAAAARYSDMNAVAMFALGRYRKLLPKARESEYVNLTRKFMGGFMLKYGSDFRVGTLEIIDCSGPPSNITVNARTAGGEKVSLRVYKAGSGFLVRDMKVGSIWLVQQMRSTFVGTISREGGNIEALFKYLKR